MGDKAHVGLVDAHAEGDGGHHHHAFFAQEAILVGLAQPGVQAGMVGQGGDALRLQPLGDLFHALAALAVDDAGVASVLGLDEAQQLAARVGLLDDAVADVGSVKGADELARAFQLQPLDDVSARDVVGGGGERHARRVRVARMEHAQGRVLRAEVMAPLAHAVGFVDGKQAQQAALVE